MKHYFLSLRLTAVFLWFVGLTLFAQNEQSFNLDDTIPFDSKVIKGKLDNGLTYYIRQNAKPKNIEELRLVVNAGSILEDDDQQGLAHFVEHMCFNGTEHFKKNDLVKYLQSIGVEFGNDLNAYTSFDQTVYMLPIPSEKESTLDSGLLVIRDWAGSVTFEGEEIDKERGVILEEMRLGKGAMQRMRDKYFPTLFKNSHYAERLPIGKKEILENFEHNTLRRFYHEWYRPDLMAVVAIGDVDPKVMEKKIKKLFGDLKMPENPRERKLYPVPDHQETLVKVVSDKESPYTIVQIMYKDDPEKTVTWRDYKGDLAEAMFNGMMNKRLSELTKAAEPPFAYGYTGYGGLTRTKNAYMSIAIVGAGGVDKALKALITENQRVKKYGFTQTELERYKKEYLKNLKKKLKEQDKTESKNYVYEYINNFLEEEPSPGIEAEYRFAEKYLPDITLDEVNALANKWIKDYNRVVIVAAAEKEGVQLPTEEEVKEWLENADNQQVEAYVDNVSNRPLMDKIPEPAEIVSKKTYEKSGITEYTFKNGLKVVVKPTNFKNDEILFTAYGWGGSSQFNNVDYRSAEFADDLVSESGVNKFNKIELDKLLADKNIKVSPYVYNLSQGFQGNATPEDFETALQLINLYFTAPNFDQKAFASVVNKQKMIIPNLLKDPFYYFSNQVQHILADNHPRGNYMITPEELDKLNFTVAKKAYKKMFGNPGDFTFFFAGNIDMEKALPMFQKYLGSIPSNGETNHYKDLGVRPPAGPLKKIVYKGQDPKSQVRIYYKGDAKYSPEQSFLLSSLGKALTIKLIENLREDMSGVYGVGSYGYMSRLPYENYTFTIAFPCGPENVDKLTQAAYREVEKIKKNGPPEEDVEKVIETQLINLKQNLEKNSYWLSEMKSYWQRGDNPEKILNQEEQIKSLQAKALKKAAKKYLKDKSKIEVVLMPEKTDNTKQ